MEYLKERRTFLKYVVSLSAFLTGTSLSLKGHRGFMEAEASTGPESTSPAHSDSMKIDIFTHVAPQKYADALQKTSPVNTVLSDLDQRFHKMDQMGDIRQVLTLGGSPIESIASPEMAVDLAKLANDGMAEMVEKYPDRFAGAAAALPMNNMEAAFKELDRAINDLNLKGVQIFTSVNGKPLDSPEFIPLYEMMSQYDLPIWIHPVSHENKSYYPIELGSKNDFSGTIGWPHATSMAMMRLAASGVLEKFIKLKFITHHSGGTVPYLAKRIELAAFRYEGLSRPIIESLRLFYNDTAVQGNAPNLMCANAFCGADHQLFGTDFPMADIDMVRRVIRSIDEMVITDIERRKIYADNAKRLLRLT